MDKILILKILGKKNGVDFEDQIYVLREITDNLRVGIITNSPIKEKNQEEIVNKLRDVLSKLSLIKEEVEGEGSIVGYTNSKKYLVKFIDDLCENIKGLIEGINMESYKDFVCYNNMIMDLVLQY